MGPNNYAVRHRFCLGPNQAPSPKVSASDLLLESLPSNCLTMLCQDRGTFSPSSEVKLMT